MDASDQELLSLTVVKNEYHEAFLKNLVDLARVEEESLWSTKKYLTPLYSFVPESLVAQEGDCTVPNFELIPPEKRTKNWLTVPSTVLRTWIEKAGDDTASMYTKIFMSGVTTAKALPLQLLLIGQYKLMFSQNPYVAPAGKSVTPSENARHYAHLPTSFIVLNVEITERQVTAKNSSKFTSQRIEFLHVEDVLRLSVDMVNGTGDVVNTLECARTDDHITMFTSSTSQHTCFEVGPDGFRKEVRTGAPAVGRYSAAIVQFVRIVMFRNNPVLECSVAQLYTFK